MPNTKYITFTYFKMPELITNYCENLSLLPDFKYLVAQLETSNTGRIHIQGYVEFYEKKSYKETVSLIMPGCHHEHRKGSRLSARYYCMKKYDGIYEMPLYYWTPPKTKVIHHGREDGTDYIEIGTWETDQGKRNDINNVRELINNGTSLAEIICEHATSYQSARMAELIYKYKITHRDKNDPPDIRWYYGASGTGKTRSVYDEFDDDDIYPSNEFKWWDGYTQQPVILIDDMRKDYAKYHVLIKLIDRYPLQVSVKGTMSKIKSSTIIITSAYSPYNLYETREDLWQLIRRITTIHLFHEDGSVCITKINPKLGKEHYIKHPLDSSDEED